MFILPFLSLSLSPLVPNTSTTTKQLFINPSLIKPTSSLPPHLPTPATPNTSNTSNSNITNNNATGSDSTQGQVSQNVFEQIMKTPSIFQEVASTITQPKRYSDAVGKRPSSAENSSSSSSSNIGGSSSSMNIVKAPAAPTSTGCVSSGSGQSGSVNNKINLAPGSRPTVNNEKVSVVIIIFKCLCMHMYLAVF